MNRLLRRALAPCVVLIAAAVSIEGTGGMDPRDLMAGIPATTGESVFVLDGTLKRMFGVDRWRVYVNDEICFESASGAAKSETEIGTGLVLREGDNLVVLESVTSDAMPIERWTTHVSRTTPQAGRQYALLARGDGADATARGTLSAFRDALSKAGVDDANVETAASWEEMAGKLSSLARRTTARDRVLIYYAGLGRINRVDSEPVLLFPKAESKIDSLPVGNLIREASDLPSASILLDIAYTKPTGPADAPRPRSQQQAAQSTSAAWMRWINQADNLELAYTNPLLDASSGFMQDFIQALRSTASGDSCNTFARLAQPLASDNAKRTAAWPVFYTRTASSFRFCPPALAANAALLEVKLAPVKDGNPPLRFVNVTIPAAPWLETAPAELTVDGVPVLRRLGLRARQQAAVDQRAPRPHAAERSAAELRLPVGPGRHVVALSATPVTGAVNRGAAIGGPTTDFRYGKWSKQLTAEPAWSAIPPVTTDTGLTLPFVVGDQVDRPVRYEVRNNGVVVLQDVVTNPPKVMRTPITSRIPLTVGDNNIVLDVMRDDFYASARISVIRRPSQPVRALIVGVNTSRGSKRIEGAEADAERMSRLLLEYTDAVPASIELLTGAQATKTNITEAIKKIGAPRLNDPLVPPDGPGDTFILYFAGYGLSIESATGAPPTRCLVPADFDESRKEETCLATREVDEALAKVGRALVIVDASYDGRADTPGRTFESFSAPDPNWRRTSGTEHPDRAFLVASASNAVALESTTTKGGLFTLALEKAIRGQLDKAEQGDARLSLLDAYELAREDTSVRSNRRQVPVMKGVLSAPFAFVRKLVPEMKQEAAGAERAARSDATSMRRLDADRLQRALRLYDKILAITPGDVEARIGRARVLMLAGNLEETSRAVDSALADTSLAPLAAAEWLFLRAEVKTRRGKIGDAIEDAAAVPPAAPSHTAAVALLGILYAATHQHQESLSTLQSLLEPDAVNTGALTGDEIGRVILHTYLILRRLGDPVANLMIDSFTDSYKGKLGFLRVSYQNGLMARLFPRKSWAIRTGQVGVQEPWPHLVAQYLRSGKGYEDPLNNFLENSKKYDPRDPDAFACVLHFYLGMARLLDNKIPSAIGEFTKAEETKRTDYIEYWFAKSELERMTGRIAQR